MLELASRKAQVAGGGGGEFSTAREKVEIATGKKREAEKPRVLERAATF